MTNEPDRIEEGKPNQIGARDNANIGVSTITGDPQIKQDVPSLGGWVLRFAGMTIIVAVMLLALVLGQEPAIFIGLLFLGSVGAAMHYKGRKLAPGKLGASILGGILGGVASSAVVIIGMLFFAAMFLDGCKAFLKL